MIPAKYEMPVRAPSHLRSQPVLGTTRIAEVYHKTAVGISEVDKEGAVGPGTCRYPSLVGTSVRGYLLMDGESPAVSPRTVPPATAATATPAITTLVVPDMPAVFPAPFEVAEGMGHDPVTRVILVT
jgi:hypothetical protein